MSTGVTLPRGGIRWQPTLHGRSDSNEFLACGIAAKTKLIVSGDKHLLDVSGYQGITVLKPRAFVDKYLK